MSDLDDAFRQADQMVVACRHAAEKASVPSVLGVAGNGGLEFLNAGGLRTQTAKEQQEYFRGWVYTSIRPIAQSIAERPMRMGLRHDRPIPRNRSFRGRAVRPVPKDMLLESMKSDADTLELIDSHTLLKSFARPNPIMTTWHIIYAIVASLELTGKGFWWMPMVNGRRQIWPIPTSWMTPHHSASEYYTKWTMRNPESSGGESEIPGNEVVYFFYPHPADPFGAISPLQAQAYSVFADEAMQESQARTFKNGIFPSLAVIAGDVTNAEDDTGRPLLYDDQRKIIMDALRKMFGGQGKAGSYVILDALIKDIKPISMKPAEMDWMNSGDQMATRINTGFGTNPIVVGKVESANRATSITAAEHFADFTINTKIELISQTLTHRVGPMFDPSGQLVIWLEPVRIKDVEATRADYELGFEAGAVTLNEYRVNVLNLPPVIGGDACYVPAKMILKPMKIEPLSASDVSDEEDEEEIEDAEIVQDEEEPEDAE